MHYNKYAYILFSVLFTILLASCDSATQVNPGETRQQNPPLMQTNSGSQTDPFEQDSTDTQNLEDDDCPKDYTIIIPCDPDGGGVPAPGTYTLQLVTPNFSFSVEDEASESDAIYQLHGDFTHFFGGIMTETEYALRDTDISDVLAGLPFGLGGGHEGHFSPLPYFWLDRKARITTSINNSNLGLEISLFDAQADLRLQSTKPWTSDAIIEVSIDQPMISDLFNIGTAEFENFQFNLTGLDVDIDRGFPLGDIESAADLITFIGAIFGVEGNIVNNIVRNNVEDEIRNFFNTNINPNAFIADQLDLLADYNLGPIDGIPADELLPILANLLRNFEASAELYVEMPEGHPYREGLVQLTLSANAMNEAKSIYYAQN